MTDNRYRETPSAADMQAQAGRLARELGDSAHQVWLAGIGALARAQSEGSKLFEQLADEGRAVGDGASPTGEGTAAARLESLRHALDGALGRASAKANEAWDSVGRAFEHRVQQALRQMDVPTREDLDALGVRIDALTRELQIRTGAAQASATSTSPASPIITPDSPAATSTSTSAAASPVAGSGVAADGPGPAIIRPDRDPHPDAGIG